MGDRYLAPAVIAAVMLIWSGSTGLPARTAASTQSIDVAIRAAVATEVSPASVPVTVADRAQLTAIYDARGYAPLWIEPSGRPTEDASAALGLLDTAAAHGLDPVDYATAVLKQSTTRFSRVLPAGVEDIASFDVAMTLNMLRYLDYLHFGRVQPGAVGFGMPARERDDLVGRLRQAVTEHRVAALEADLAPTFPLYWRLRVALSKYRRLDGDPQLQSLQLPDRTVHPGDRCDVLPQLRRVLVALGDLPVGDISSRAMTYEGDLVEGVQHFQRRHGLAADGVLGKSTIAALRVPLSFRAHQIELALERLRWLPNLGTDRFIAVNIPMFRAWGVEGAARGYEASFSTDVIVGRALNTRTPVLVEELEDVIFRPYWNVPSSIVRKEILPALARQPDYLERHGMELVSGQSDDAPVVPLSGANVERFRDGSLRVRQRPGPGNSLGLVKFVFPNDANVYVHATPVPELFSRARRDFSHGCIRVADPVGLAEWVLSGTPGWTQDRIVAAMNATESSRIHLKQPIRVILFYLTAVVLPDDDTVFFVDDLYGHDMRLDRYLTMRRGS